VSPSEFGLYALLIFSGAAAGWLNTVAGGGSMLTVPALMWYGLPGDVANGTSRIAILAQGVTAVAGFRREKQLDTKLLYAIATPSILGAVLGAYVATLIPSSIFEPILIAALFIMAGSMFLKPESLKPPAGAVPIDPRTRPGAWLALFATGFYGGFLQAGVGLVLLAVFASLLHIDLVRGNGLKVAVIFLYNLLVVFIFAARSRVDFTAGAVLAIGHVIGAEGGVRFSVNRGQDAIKKVVFAMIIASGIALLLRR
jgi:uncharacterized membrane protein YfcA